MKPEAFRKSGVLLLGCAWLALAGCELEPEQAEVAETLDRTVSALEAGDLVALWNLSAPNAQRQILQLHENIHTALAAVDKIFPVEQREAVRRALGAGLVADLPPGTEDVGPKFLAKLLDPRKMRLDERARDGLRSKRATIDGAQAIIHTSAGETFTFERTSDGWRSRLIVDLLDADGEARHVREAVAAVLEGADAHRLAWRESRDPKAPQGAYNLMREALVARPVDAARIYSLLGKPARGALVDVLKASRAVQRELHKRFKKKEERTSAYEEHGLDIYVSAASDRALYEAWAATDWFVPPFEDRSPPAATEGDEASGHVSVVTDDGGKIEMVREDDGYWRCAGQADSLKQLLSAPLDKTMLALNPPDDASDKKGKKKKKRKRRKKRRR